MPWNSTWPIGNVSVKANEATGNQNTTYIETTMGNSVVGTNTAATRDHFWNVGTNEDGRHRFINSPKFTVGGVATDPVIGTGMDAVFYLKQVSSSITSKEWFTRNTGNIYQVSPVYLSGTILLNPVSPSDYTDIVAVPANSYGEIFMFTTGTDKYNTVTGFFKSNNVEVQAWANLVLVQGNPLSSPSAALKFGNGTDKSGFNIRARPEDAATNQTWVYKITYRAT